MCRPKILPKIEECIYILRKEFGNFQDPRKRLSKIELTDFLASGYAIFALKNPSLLAFENSLQVGNTINNLLSLFKVKHIPSDTHLRDVLDDIVPEEFRIIYKRLFSLCQRSKMLEPFEFLRGKNNEVFYLLAVDGTGYFRSHKLGCDSCIQYDKREDDGYVTSFGHQMLGASLVHPNSKEVFSLCPEPIMFQDGNKKNDNEIIAFKRFVTKLKKDHPKLNLVFALDALYANKPCVDTLSQNDYSFIIAIKDSRGTIEFQLETRTSKGEILSFEDSYTYGEKIIKTCTQQYRCAKGIKINSTFHHSPSLNFVEIKEETKWIDSKGEEKIERNIFSWVTDLKIDTLEEVKLIMKGGRCRWKIENETFNTLKNQGYNLEHNYGHGKNNLSVNFIHLMFLAFFVDQIQQAGCSYFKKILKKKGTRSSLWQSFRSGVEWTIFTGWVDLFTRIDENTFDKPKRSNSS